MVATVYDFQAIKRAMEKPPRPQPYCWRCHNERVVKDSNGKTVSCPECKGHNNP